MADATIRAGGLASGMDTNSIIEQLIAIEKRPISLLRSRQTGFKSQVSTLGDIISKVQALQTAADGLAKGGVMATKVEGTNTGFTGTSGTGALAGRHEIQVTGLARSAQARSTAFASTTTQVRGGTLTLGMSGTNYNITVGDGSTLADVAFAINQSDAPLTATVINDGTNNYLSLVNNDTGYPLTGAPGGALTITENYTGTASYQQLGLAITQPATNSQIAYNGLTINRTSNTISDVIPGVTLSLKALTAAPETLAVSNDTSGTTTNLQKFVDAYNAANSLIQSQLAASAGTNRGATLAGDGALRSLQNSLRGLLTKTVGTTANVRSLADVGIKSARDGTLSLDSTTLTSAMGRDASAVNDLFANATSGMGAITKTLSDNYTKTDGILAARRTGLESNIKRIDADIVNMERRVEAKRQTLIAQFTAMEKIVSTLKSTGNFLAQQKWGIDTGE